MDSSLTANGTDFLFSSGHNPDSQCVECCAKIEAIHSLLIPLLLKIDEKVEAFDTNKFSETLEKLQKNPLLKMLMK